MKIIRKITFAIILCISFFTLYPYSSIQAQVVGVIGKQAVKQNSKSLLKKSAKHITKNIAKKNAIKSSTKIFSKEAIQKTTELATKKTASKMMRIASTKTAKEIIESKATKQIKKKIGYKILKENNKKILKKSIKEETQKLALQGSKKIALKVSNKTTNELLKKMTQKEAIESILNKRAAEEWIKYSRGKEHLNKLLLDDITNSPQLRKLFSSNPQLLESYYNMAGSIYRKDITMLRYISENSNKARKMYYRSPRKRVWLSGSDLVYQDTPRLKGNKTLIRRKDTNEILGYQSGNAQDGYIIELTKNDNPLGDLYPMANTTYRGTNFIINTDRYGRVIRMRYSADKNVTKAIRDKNHIGKIKYYKSDYDVLGNQKTRTGTYDDVAGHIQPDSWGGESNFLNIIPQNNSMNSKGLWKDSEMAGLRAAKKGGIVVRDITIEYPNKATLRPSALIVTQTLNGKIQKVKGQMMNEVIFKNIMVKND